MLIICPSCSTSYRIDPSSLGASGRQVRCARCRTMWLATVDSALATAASDTGPGDDRPVAEATRDDASDPGMSDWAAVEADSEAQASAPAAGPAPVAEAPSLGPEQDGGGISHSPAMVEPIREDIQTIAIRRTSTALKPRKRRKPRLVRPGMPVVILSLAIVLVGLIQWRGAVVRVFPQTGSLFGAIGLPVNLRGMTFENLKTSQEFQDGVTVLVVEGTIVNKSRSTVEVPRLRFALRNLMGQEVYAWTALPQRSNLAPDEHEAFRSRLASPPIDGREVVVRFFTRHDVASGLP